MARKDSTALSRTTVSSTVASDSRGGCDENTRLENSVFSIVTAMEPYLMA